MGKELSPFEKLDEVLKLIKRIEQSGLPCTDVEIIKFSAVNNINLGPLIGKLKKNDYIFTTGIKRESGAGNLYDDTIYSLTFEGDCFIQAGGYTKRNKKEITQKCLQSSQTWAIVIGTFLAGIYGIFEIIKACPCLLIFLKNILNPFCHC